MGFLNPASELWLNLSKTKSAFGSAEGSGGLAAIVGTVIKGILGVVGLIFLALVFFAGFKWLFAAGDETKLKEAQGTIMQAAIGLAIVLSAYSISVFITNIVLKSIGK